jgi:hypothetical protein
MVGTTVGFGVAGTTGDDGTGDGVTTGVGEGDGDSEGAIWRTAPSAAVPATMARAIARSPAAAMLPAVGREEDGLGMTGILSIRCIARREILSDLMAHHSTA